jgi:hypothetical protein
MEDLSHNQLDVNAPLTKKQKQAKINVAGSPSELMQTKSSATEQMMDDLGPSTGRGSVETAGDVATDTNKGRGEDARGLRAYMNQDLQHTKDYASDVASSLAGEKANDFAGGEKGSVKSPGKGVKNATEDYLTGMGRGSKALGGAKVAGYMVGASMLMDMLNPFDDD